MAEASTQVERPLLRVLLRSPEIDQICQIILLEATAMMKTVTFTTLWATLLLLLPFSAFARSNRSSFMLADPAMIGSTQLQPGYYKVEWNGSGNQVHISILQNGKTLTTTSGMLIQQQRPSPYNAVDIKTNSANEKIINGFQFANKKQELVVKRG
jgi:hypothetical protein